MSTVAIQSTFIWQPMKFVASRLAQSERPSADTDVGAQVNRARRDFILEMMDAHPDAFQHEFDCQTVMKFYPSGL